MATFKHVIAIVIAFGAFALAAPAPAPASDVTGKELLSVLPGKTILGSNSKCKTITYNVMPIAAGAEKGDITIDCDGRKDDGKWWVDGDKLCKQFNNFSGGNKFCFDVKKDGSGELAFYRAWDGTKTNMRLKK